MESSPNAATPPMPPTRPRPRWGRRLLLFSVIGLGLLILLVAAAPSLASIGFVQNRVKQQLAAELGTGVELENYSIGWFSGLKIEGLAIANPPGYPAEQPMLRLGSLTGDISLPGLLRRRIDLTGKVEGLELRVYQRADGSVNLQQIGGPKTEPKPGAEPGTKPEAGDAKIDLDAIRLDLQLVGARIDIIREPGGVLESMRNVNAMLTKPFGSTDVKLSVTSELHGGETSATPGTVALRADVDANFERPVMVEFETSAMDLSRYRPLVEGFVGQGQLSAFAGVVAGKLDARIDLGRKDVQLGGKLELAAPHFAGPLLQGMELRAERWILQPNLKVALADGQPPALDTGGLLVDLEFLKVNGIPAATARQIAGDRPALGLDFNVDLAKLAQLGGPIPAELRQSQGTVVGQFAFVTVAAAFDPAHLKEHFAEYVNAAGKVQLDRYTIEGNELRDIAGTVAVVNGAVHFDGTAGFGGGTAKIAADTTLLDRERMPGTITIDVENARVQDAAVGVVRYALPLLAGLKLEEKLDFEARVSTKMAFQGPLLSTKDEGVLAWLNLWTGGGDFALADGKFTPAAELAQLLSLAGESSQIGFDSVSSKFALAKGSVETSLMKLGRESSKIGLQGRVNLNGEIDYSIDVRELIAKQQYGEQILAALGDSGAVAKLAGTLDAPKLALPDIGKLAADALKKTATDAAEKALRDNLEKNVGDELKKGLEGLIKRKK